MCTLVSFEMTDDLSKTMNNEKLLCDFLLVLNRFEQFHFTKFNKQPICHINMRLHRTQTTPFLKTLRKIEYNFEKVKIIRLFFFTHNELESNEKSTTSNK